MAWLPPAEFTHQCWQHPNKFVQWVSFGGEKVLTQSVQDEQRKFIKYNHLVTNLLSFHTLVNMTKALHQMHEDGHTIDLEALATFSPYRTEHINRFGDYVINRNRKPASLEHIESTLPAIL